MADSRKRGVKLTLASLVRQTPEKDTSLLFGVRFARLPFKKICLKNDCNGETVEP